MLANYLGDASAVCTTPMCDSGTASVQAMDALYQSLGAPGQFQSQHDSIMGAYNAAYSWYSDLIPFNPGCCTLQQIGSQADALTVQMGGAPNGPSTQGAGLSLQSMVILGVVVFFAISYVGNRL